jgi:CRP-like cAMP-binding protein
VTVKKGNKTVKAAELGKGDFFGEMALISNEPRSATVTAIEVTELFVLQKNEFDQILMKNPAISQEMRQAFYERKAKNK